MTKTICDICGKEMPTEKYSDPIEKVNFCISSHGKKWDICTECRVDLNRWMTIRKSGNDAANSLLSKRKFIPESDILTVSFDNGSSSTDKSALLVSRKCKEQTIVLKMEVGEQADILYHLLTEQTAKAEIKAEESEEE